jgi:phthiocerol/phenolphthiocerol synthesis type-I polyketide synthase A
VRVPGGRWDADAFFSADHTVPGTICSREGGFLTSWRPDEFDAEFFGISPREAAGMDPQQRLLMEVAWEALENGGFTGHGIRGSQAGVFVGSTTNDYSLTFAGRLRPEDIDPYIPFGNAPNFAAGRLAYFLGVHGPAVVIDTACSSSLVAVHLACQSLRRRESDLALAAGVNLMLSPENSIACSRWGMLASDGRCKTFDAAADGYVRSEGAGVVVLKRLSDAVRDGDSVWAVVRGSAVNQDGPSSGQTVPSGPAQQAVVRQALAAARLQPSDIDYIEAHGTGTALGDPIELDALSRVFGRRDGAAQLVLGSVKTNLGHLESASGVAGFIKTVLSLYHGFIPRHLNFERLTPHAGADASRFRVASQAMSWPSVRRVRRAGVSSFGVSGTNAHVVLEQAPVAEAGAHGVQPAVSTLVVSGKSPTRIASTASMLAQWLLADGAQVPLADVAHTVNHHRTRHAWSAAVCARDRRQAVAGLQALAAGELASGVVEAHQGPAGSGTVFVYSGQGAQWAGMGQQLLADEPVFAAAIAELEPVFVEQVGFSLQQIVAGGVAVSGDAQVQPVIMGLQLALTELWRSYGVSPDAVVGHSMGEVTAAVVAGALSLADGLKVIATRSRLMSRLAGQGAVALLELDAQASAALIADYPGVAVTVYSSPRQTVVSGPVQPVDAVIAAVSAQDRFARRVNMEVASHTALMDSILPELGSELAGVRPQSPTIRFISTITETTTPMLNAQYWVDNVRQPVRFRQAISTAAEHHGTFVEISPHPTLTHAITETLAAIPAADHALVTPTLKRGEDEALHFHTQLATLARTAPSHNCGHLADIPPTPWHHGSYWISIANPVRAAESAPRPGTLLGEHTVVATTPPAHLWQARLAPKAAPYPGRHRVHGVDVIPVSVLLQTLSAVAAACDASMVSDIRFERPIVLDRSQVIQVVADGESVTVSSSLATDGQGGTPQRWVRHLSARLAYRPPQGQSHPPDGLRYNGYDEMPGCNAPAVAALQVATGIEGQPFPWSITAFRRIPGGLRADVDMPDGSPVAVLDAAVAVARLADTSNQDPMVPVAVESIRTGDEFGENCFIEILRRGGPDGELVVDITAWASDGNACLDIRGLRYAVAQSGHASTASGAADPRTLAHAIEWRPWVEHGDPERASDSLRTLAVLGAQSTARALRERLAEAGYLPAGVGDAQCVVYVADPEPAFVGETDAECAVRMTAEVADLVRQLAQRDADHPSTLWIITRGVRECASESALRSSCLWGLAGVIRAEQPELWGGLVDVGEEWDPREATDERTSALSKLLRRRTKSILALSGGEILVAVVAPVTGKPVREPLRCRPDAAYLITGGMGALGLLMAGWLADRGARRLVLAGRTPLPPRREWDSDANATDLRHKIAAIRALEIRGVTVEAVALDVGSGAAVKGLLAGRDDAGKPPIRGVIHAAGVTEGQLLTEIDDSRIRRAMWPKISGARVLHESFPPGSLDFLFLTSAAGAVFGIPGQGAYASANAYLDGLARSRHRQGCHTVSLDWVAWQGLGFATHAHVVLDELARMGSRPVVPDEAFPAWEHVDTYDIAQAVMAPLPSGHPGVGDDCARVPVRAWSEMPIGDLLVELEAELKAILAHELRMPETDIDVDRPFAEMGLNSVMAMSIRREAERLLGIELSATMLWNHPTVAALTAFLAKKLLPQDDLDESDVVLSDSTSSVLNELFDSIESAPAGERGI